MYLPLYVEKRDAVAAQALISEFGKAAGSQAADRAETSRNRGNHHDFCRWRQIERLITLLNTEETFGTIH